MKQHLEKANRLIEESSPYLLQHAYNPVDWFPWKDEAFAKAKRENKPIFLSIGYSACHWCHVMERESFENENTAKILNEYFVSIKVDREERQDIDEIYMSAIQAMTGAGGWPLSVFMTPDRKPFFGGTYFPPVDLPGRPSFDKVLLTIAHAWQENREKLIDSAEQITESLANIFRQTAKQIVSEEILTAANFQLHKNFDAVNGGFGTAPKFPQTGIIQILLNYWYRTDDHDSLDMAEKTLQAMAKGGIRDHLGGGFHRYSTDERWLVPHFEKMLYDQAMIAKVYIHAYQATGNKFYANVAESIYEYVLRDMTDPNGGFYTAEDADTDGKEGSFYIWQMNEIENILGKPNAEIFNKYYGITNKGNFEERKNILHINRTIEELAHIFNKKEETIKNIIEESKIKLLAHRNQRPKPGKDDKIITGWNGLMISSLALAGAVLEEKRYIHAAQKCANFILNNLIRDNRLMHYCRQGKVVNPGILDDYAFFILSLIDLYQADFDTKWLVHANNLMLQMLQLFENPEGGFFMTAKDDEQLFIRANPSFDNPIPSGNSIAAMILLKFGKITSEQSYIECAKSVIDAFSPQLTHAPTLMAFMLCAFDFFVGPSQEIVIAAKRPEESEAQKMIRLIRKTYLPYSILLFHHADDIKNSLEHIAPFVKNQTTIDGKAAVYICNNYACGSSITSAAKLETELKKLH